LKEGRQRGHKFKREERHVLYVPSMEGLIGKTKKSDWKRTENIDDEYSLKEGKQLKER
jgi:hypothetical protein